MAIYQHNRNFRNMIYEIHVKSIPLQYVQDINCILTDGTTVVLDYNSFADQEFSNLEGLINDLDFADAISDLRVNIDFEKIERNVDAQVDQLLKRIND